ncbi:MAG: translation elongation factor Ts [Deltaproteobacteria bacterium]|nr:translation elongation factor Ts [Deltaproteobacteria bacterium]
MGISASQVKDLREKTGAGMMDCKRALVETDGDFEGAMTYLREKGLATAQKKSGRQTSEGTIGSYIHAGGSVGVMVEVNCETDFVAKNEDFQELVKDIAMHIAAMSPLYVEAEEVPADLIEKEKAIFRVQAKESGKPDNIIEKMIDGKIKKYLNEICLLGQPFVKDSDKTVGDVITAAVTKLGENLQVGRFVRFKVGEGAEDSEGSSEGEE